MPNKTRTILEKWLFGLSEFILIFPLVLLLGIYFIERPLLWMTSLPFLFMFGYLFREIVRDKKRVIYHGFTISLSAGLTTLFHHSVLSYLFVFSMNCVILYRSTLYAEREVEKLITFTSLWLFGFPIYFISYFIYRFIDFLYPYLGFITWTGILLVVITLFHSNRHLLKSSTLSKQKQPFVTGSIKGKNQAYLLVIIGIIAIITNFNMIQYFFYKAAVTVISMILSFLALFENDKPIESTPPPAEAAFPKLEGAEPSIFAVIMEKIMQIAFYSVGLIVCIFLIFFAGKKLGYLFTIWFKWLKKHLNQIFHLSHHEHEEGVHYFDEKESLIDLKKWGKGKKNQAKELIFHLFKIKTKWEKLSDREKVRYVYRQLIVYQVKHGLTFKLSRTPREMINEIHKRRGDHQKELITLIDTYGKARYGNHDLRIEDIEEITLLLESLKKE